MTAKVADARIGCSGWSYRDWRGAFYPAGLKAKEEFAFYATQFDTTEINASFYRLPREATVEAWAARAPPGFNYAWKVSRFITHNKKLADCADSVDLVFGRMAPLGAGPALVQLPPMMRRDEARLARFLALPPRGVRLTVEFRHPSWFETAVMAILADHDAALCISDHHHAPSPWEVTASFVYVRGHGPGGRYRGRYGETRLRSWASAIGRWRGEGRQVFCYFDNDIKSAAPTDARLLKQMLGGET